MSWIRAVWVEGEKEEEGTVPDMWIENDTVLWPPVVNSLKFLKERRKPTEKWKKFPLVKIKKKSDNYTECELFDETTTAEVSEDEDRGKRPLKKKSFGADFVSDIAEVVGPSLDGKDPKDKTPKTSEKDPVNTLPAQPKKVVPKFPNPTRISRSRSSSMDSSYSKKSCSRSSSGSSLHLGKNRKNSGSRSMLRNVTSEKHRKRMHSRSGSSSSSDSLRGSSEKSRKKSGSRSSSVQVRSQWKNSSHSRSRSRSTSLRDSSEKSKKNSWSRNKSLSRSRSRSRSLRGRSGKNRKESASGSSSVKVRSDNHRNMSHSRSRSRNRSHQRSRSHSRSFPQKGCSGSYGKKSYSSHFTSEKHRNRFDSRSRSRSLSPRVSSDQHSYKGRSRSTIMKNSSKHGRKSYSKSKSSTDQGSSDEGRSPSYTRSRSSSVLDDSSRKHLDLTCRKKNKGTHKSSSKETRGRSHSRSLDLPSLLPKPKHSTPKNHSRKTGETSQATSNKEKFPMTEAKFQKRVLYLLSDIRQEISEIKKERRAETSTAYDLTKATSIEEFVQCCYPIS
ncbi:serine/arginine-rich splicing factor 4-like [Saccostrea cucullata]|uniref:serine/arginine-rich splicing factor 4-like n=1 Tax=Saccostrea cuccullata TaxID=36930 RepID=UPI002ED3100E